MSYELKYKKYKNKYLKLKNIQYGGSEAQLIIKPNDFFTFIFGVSKDMLTQIRDKNDGHNGLQIDYDSIIRKGIYRGKPFGKDITEYINKDKGPYINVIVFKPDSLYIIDVDFVDANKDFYDTIPDTSDVRNVYETLKLILNNVKFKFELNEMSVRSPSLPILIDDFKLKILNEDNLHDYGVSVGPLKSILNNELYTILVNDKDFNQRIYIKKNKENSKLEGMLDSLDEYPENIKHLNDFTRGYGLVNLENENKLYAYYNT